MKKTIIALLAYSIQIQMYAQEDFNTLKAPTVPAAMIFGYEESSIERPQDPKVFSSQIMSAISSSGVTPGMAFEITPFFMKSRTDYSLTDYLTETKYKKKLASSISLSIATSQTDTYVYGNLNPGTGISGGFRMQLLQGKVSKEITDVVENKITFNTNYQTAIASVIADINGLQKITLTDLLTLIDNKCTGFPEEKELSKLLKESVSDKFSDFYNADSLNTSNVKPFLESLGDKNIDDYAINAIKVSKGLLPSARTGSMIEFSGAISGVFQENKFNQTAFGKFQLWLTYSCRKPLNEERDIDFDFMAIARATFNNTADGVDESHYFDAGTKFQFKIKKWYIAAEGVARYALSDVGADSRFTYRLTANMEYQINSYLGAFLTFGRNFDGNSVNYDPKSSGSLLSVMGLNIGISGPEKD